MSAKNSPPETDVTCDDSAPTVVADPTMPGTTASPRPVAAPGPPSVVRTTVLPRWTVEGDGAAVDHGSVVRYEERGRLGAGGVGEVFSATDNDIGREVAIKRLLPEMQGEASLLRFASEVRTIGRLEHPNIVPVHDVGIDENGRHYFVMKRIQGETLETIIRRLQAGDPKAHAQYTFEQRTRVFVGILEAVRCAHSHGIVHRDIKPANVMVGPFGEVVLMDWGIAKRIGEDPDGGDDDDAAADVSPARCEDVSQTAAGSLIGTPAYMSPEQAAGRPVDARSDVYSLCVLFHELLCLRHYLADCRTLDEALCGVIETGAPLATFVENEHQTPVPADLAWFVARGLNKTPAERYASVDEMIDRLERRSEGLFPVQCPSTFAKRLLGGLQRFVDRHPTLNVVGLSLAALGLLALLALAGWSAYDALV